MRAYTENGCAPEFALWSFVDLGYLTYYAAYGIATGQIEGGRGRDVQRRPDGRRTPSRRTRRATTACAILMGPFTVYNKTTSAATCANEYTSADGPDRPRRRAPNECAGGIEHEPGVFHLRVKSPALDEYRQHHQRSGRRCSRH